MVSLQDLKNNSFREKINDPDVITAFNKRFESSREKPDPAILLDRIGTNQSWNSADIQFLASLDADDFYRIFKSERGRKLRNVLYGALYFQRVVNADDAMKAITRNAEEAFRKIGAESPLNASRVKQYAVVVERPDEE
jgi:hypothetical protein